MATNPNKVWGQTRIRINGILISTKPKPTFKPGGINRTPQEADGQGGMFSEMTGDASIQFNALVTPDVSLTFFQSLSDETVTVELDTGRTYVMRHAYTSEAVEATDGAAQVTMVSGPAEEMR